MKLSKEEKVTCINELSEFLGMRDVAELAPSQLESVCGIEHADAMVLFGGSIICGGDVFAHAMQRNVAHTYIIVGGAGHTTQTLRDNMQRLELGIETTDLPEAQIFEKYLETKYGLKADFLECESTNCGNNITNLLDLVKGNKLPFESVILVQDATMQRRMDAGLRKYAPNTRIINYAAYVAPVIAGENGVAFRNAPKGMWTIDRYISLIMGEIPRLTDDAYGYGPKGKDFIAHVEIPISVQDAFTKLRKELPDMVRAANPAFSGQPT